MVRLGRMSLGGPALSCQNGGSQNEYATFRRADPIMLTKAESVNITVSLGLWTSYNLAL